MKRFGLYLGVLGLMTIVASAQEGNDRLAGLKNLKIDDGTITEIKRDDSETMTFADGQTSNKMAPRTVVKITLHPAKGSSINVEIWLPDAEKWNKRFLALGNGGAAGSINPKGLAGSCAGGFAVATTDMGTAPNADSGVGNSEVWKDFGFRATHLMTVCAKQVVQAYYGKDPEYSYFSGGSTGGQQALQEAQRYPEDYDGITAGIPAHCRTPLHAYFLWNDQILNKCRFTESQEKNVIAAGIEYMAPREVPALAGKCISDPRVSGKDIEAVIDLAMKKDPTLTKEHAEAMRKLFEGPRHPITGERLFCGIPLGSSLSAAHGHLYLFKWVFGGDKKLADIDFGNDMDTYTAKLGPYLNAENPDLSRFEKKGGKLLMYSGTADSVVPYTATLDYYERVVERSGSLDQVKTFFRFYLIPGMGHGGGEKPTSPGINAIPNFGLLVMNWREKGVAPEMITVKRTVGGNAELEMPLYPYPMKTAWDTTTNSYKPVEGPRGGVERVAERFRPPAAD